MAGGKKISDFQKGNVGERFKALGYEYSAPEKEKVEKDSTMDSESEEKLIFFYHPDHLGSTSYVTDADGNIAQHVEYIPYGEVFVEERNSQFSTNFLFNAKELDNETGLYYYGARYLDPTGAMWLSVDPVFHAGTSPYAYCLGNPVKMIDPDGRDVITTDENGLAVKVEKQNGHNIFMDNNGTVLTFNDNEKADGNMLTKKIEINDRVYMPIDAGTAKKMITSVDENNKIKQRGFSFSFFGKDVEIPYGNYFDIAKASHSKADFATHSLTDYFNYNRSGYESSIQCDREAWELRSYMPDDCVYFRFEGLNVLFNIYDAGNFMWGAWSKDVGLSDFEAKWGPELNEFLHGRIFGDSDADQSAIKQGRIWYK